MLYLAIMSMPDPIENLWEALLSRQADQVQAAYQELTPTEQAAVLNHLHRMATEDGWQPEQRLSARFALQTIIQAAVD